ncbi:MAG: ribonuclease E inhibitor RraB [Alcanivorax sp.]
MVFNFFKSGKNKNYKREDFPDDADGESIWRVVEDGSDLSKPMSVDFFVSVPSLEKGKDFEKVALEHGYKTSVEKDSETENFTCYCSKVFLLNYDGVLAEQEKLDALAKPHDGYIDGWGTFGNKEE